MPSKKKDTVKPQDELDDHSSHDLVLSSGDSISVLVEQGFMDKVIDRASAESLIPYHDPLIAEITYEFKKNHGLVRSSGAMTRVERVVFNVLAWNASAALKKRGLHKIGLSEIIDLMEKNSLNSGTYRQHILAVLESLRKMKLELITESDSVQRNTTVTGILSDYHFKAETNEVYYGFTSITAELLSNSSFAAQIDLKTQADIESRYSLALMEICQPYQTQGHTPFFDVDTWRRFLGAEGETYSVYKHFYDKLLRKAIKELRERDIMKLTLEKKRAGKYISHLRFVFDPEDEQRVLLSEQMQIRNTPVFKKLMEIGVSVALATKSIQEDPVHALEIAEETERKLRAGEIKSPSGWAATMLKNKHQVKAPIERKIEAEKAKAEADKAKAQKAAIKKQKSDEGKAEEIRAEERRFMSREVDLYIKDLTQDDVIEMANTAVMKRSGSPDDRQVLDKATRDVYGDGGEYDQSVFAQIVKNNAFRSYVYSMADPGGIRRIRHIKARFGVDGILI